MLVGQINQNLWDIPEEIETAMKLCQRPVIQAPTPQVTTIAPKSQVKTIDFMSEGINLSILYSKIYTADNQIRDCRLNCEAGSSNRTGCSIFVTLQREYKSEMEELYRLIAQHSLNIHSNELSIEDQKYIGQILNLLDDIEKEREKIIECIDSLKNK